MNYLFLMLLASILLSCSNSTDVNDSPARTKKLVIIQKESKTRENQREEEPLEVIEEAHFWSNSIGANGLYRLEMKQLRSEIVIADIELFKKKDGKWSLIQHQTIEKDGITHLDPKISDYNNDGFLDLTFHYSTAARGANDVRKLYIFDTINERLREIKNSDHFPNLMYNEEMDCIDAQLFYGCCATVFLKLKHDSLREFAGVEACNDKISVYIFDKKRKMKYLVKDKITKQYSDFPRFINYKPLKERIANAY